MVHDSGRPNFGVNPPLGGREPSFPNPTANLVSTRRNDIILCFDSGTALAVASWTWENRCASLCVDRGYRDCFLCCFFRKAAFFVVFSRSKVEKGG